MKWPALLLIAAATARAVTVSGTVTTDGGLPVAGATVTIEQVGGEFGPRTATTLANGTYSVSDPMLFGSLRIRVAAAAFLFTPAERNLFNDGVNNVTGQNFTAFSREQIDVFHGPTVASPALFTPASVSLAAQVGSEVPHTLTLSNPGSATLTGIAASFSGANAADFSLAPPPATLGAGASVTIAVRVTPGTAPGTRTATLRLASSDSNESPFVINLTATDVSLEVTNTNDSGPGSLRAAVAGFHLIADQGEASLSLHPSLSGQTIQLHSEIVMNWTTSATLRIDATPLPGGLTLDGRDANRLISLATGSTSASFVRLRFQNGNAGLNADGGAIFNAGALLMANCVIEESSARVGGGVFNGTGAILSPSQCFFDENAAVAGGGIFNQGECFARRCTLSGNAAVTGGAIHNEAILTAAQCTIAGNSAFQVAGTTTVAGGGLYNNAGSMEVRHCTIAGNAASGGFGGEGGGIYSKNADLRLANSIIHGNSSGMAGRADVLFSGGGGRILDRFGVNFAQSFTAGGTLMGGSFVRSDPLLAPLGDYGGPTPTMALLPGSPARNAAIGFPGSTDQRGFPMPFLPEAADCGAYEAGASTRIYQAYIYERLPAAASFPWNAPVPDAQHAIGFDFDGDGQNNEHEWLFLTDAADGGSFFDLAIAPNGANWLLTFRSAQGRNYTLGHSDTLAPPSFVPTPGQPVIVGTGGDLSFTVPDLGLARCFFTVTPGP